MRRRLLAAGFSEVGTSGSHAFQHREIAAGTLRSILRQTALSIEEFEKL
jgi:predicted RNA binding protein YcfA (HicA-like mRNA interferase family)